MNKHCFCLQLSANEWESLWGLAGNRIFDSMKNNQKWSDANANICFDLWRIWSSNFLKGRGWVWMTWFNVKGWSGSLSNKFLETFHPTHCLRNCGTARRRQANNLIIPTEKMNTDRINSYPPNIQWTANNCRIRFALFEFDKKNQRIQSHNRNIILFGPSVAPAQLTATEINIRSQWQK